MGIDDESSHPELCSEVADGVTRNIVCLFREPDAGNPPVRFDEREQETELGQTGLRRVTRKRPTATGRLKPLRLFSTLLVAHNNEHFERKRLCLLKNLGSRHAFLSLLVSWLFAF